MTETRLIIEVSGGVVAKIYTDAPASHRIRAAILDRDTDNLEANRHNAGYTALLAAVTGWRTVGFE